MLNTSCPVCASSCSLLDVLDLNKSCEVQGSSPPPLIGIPVYYTYCNYCGFCFAPEICKWSKDEFKKYIYNEEYVNVDPDYLDARPRLNAKILNSLFPNFPKSIKHIDYGGGQGLLSGLLRSYGWNSASYDPYVDVGTSEQPEQNYELITAFEVFEHVPSVQDLFSDLDNILSDSGLIIFSTLLSDGSIQPNQRLTWWYASPRNGHISLFSKKSLHTLASSKGFHFASFSNGLHVFFRKIPTWAQHLFITK